MAVDFNKLPPEQQHEIIMRSAPHLYGQHLSKNLETGVSEWVAARHLAYIGRRIAKGIARGGLRMIVNIGPRHGKSFLISKWLPLWFLEMFPKKRVMVCSSTGDLADFWGRECRNEVEKNRRIRFKLREDSTAVSQWNTLQGGGMKCQGVGGNITGFGYDLGILDDPTASYDDAVNPTIQEKLHNWWEYEFMRRKEPGASVIVLMHRFAVTDLCGWLMENDPGNWEIIKLPVLAMPGDLLGRQPGEALWPERFPADCKDIEEAKRSPSWNSMYQQDPQPENTNRVYYHYTQDQNVAQDPNETAPRKGPEETLSFCIDFNVNPGGHAEVGQYDFREDMFRIDREFHGPGWRTEHIMKEFIEWLKAEGHRPGKCPWKCINIYGDRSGRSGNTVTTETDYGLIQKMLTAAGVPFRLYVPYKNPPINDRVLTVNEALRDQEGRVHVKIAKRCKRLIVDLGTQPPDENNQPEKEKDRTLGHACLVAGTRVLTDRGEVPIERIKVGDRVWTRKGYRLVLHAWQSHPAAPTIRLRLSTGRVLRGTGDHPVWVRGKGWTPLALVRKGAILQGICTSDKEQPCGSKPSRTGVLSITGIPTQSEDQIASTSPDAPTGRKKCASTALSGRPSEGPSPRDGTSTTRTTTPPTTASTTFAANRVSSILASTDAHQKRLHARGKASKSPFDALRHGTAAKKASRGTKSTLRSKNSAPPTPWSSMSASDVEKRFGKKPTANGSSSTAPMPAAPAPGCAVAWTMKPAPASCAENLSRSTNTTKQRSADVSVVRRSRGTRSAVYDLTVEDQHEFFANGVLVKNCDAFGYWAFWVRPVRRVAFKPQKAFAGG